MKASLFCSVAIIALAAHELTDIRLLTQKSKTAMNSTQGSASGRISDLPNLNEKSLHSIVEQLGRERAAIESELIGQLRSDCPKEKKIPAIFLLGIYRMDVAVPDLLKFISLEVPAKDHEKDHFRPPLWGTHPTVEALIRIGKPASSAILKHLENVEDNETRKLSVKVIRYIEGPEVGKFILQTAIEKQTDPEKKKELREALKYFAAEIWRE